jgi:hypothetical protein
MNRRLVNLMGLVMVLGIILISASCKKNTDPKYPQLMGKWLKTNSEDSIYLYVDNIGGTLYITQMITRVAIPGGYMRYAQSSTSGLAAIDNNTNYFYLVIDPAGADGPTYIDGTFNPTTLVLMGTFAFYPGSEPPRQSYPYTIQRP